MINWLKEFIDDIRTQEIAINSTKTGSAALGTDSAIGLFTPYAPLALAGMVAAGGVAVATSIGDMIANKVTSGNLEEKVDSMNSKDAELGKLQKKLNKQAEPLAKVRNSFVLTLSFIVLKTHGGKVKSLTKETYCANPKTANTLI